MAPTPFPEFRDERPATLIRLAKLVEYDDHCDPGYGSASGWQTRTISRIVSRNSWPYLRDIRNRPLYQSPRRIMAATWTLQCVPNIAASLSVSFLALSTSLSIVSVRRWQ